MQGAWITDGARDVEVALPRTLGTVTGRLPVQRIHHVIDECPIRLLRDLASRRVHDVGEALRPSVERYVESVPRALVLDDRDVLARRAPARDPLPAVIDRRPVVRSAVEDPHRTAAPVGFVDEPHVAADRIERGEGDGCGERATHEAPLVPRLTRPQRDPATVGEGEDADALGIDTRMRGQQLLSSEEIGQAAAGVDGRVPRADLLHATSRETVEHERGIAHAVQLARPFGEVGRHAGARVEHDHGRHAVATGR